MGAVKELYIVDEHGERVAVILPLDGYGRLREDLHDPAVVAERRQEPTVTFEELKKRF
ncbi:MULTISPECIES: type II toxin-antitoxin system Phd/YefM family antitoxin [unclassified Methanoculleus]|uniref:type II toxin-antitoxin system Phd/YefM family antitoxin n=1 Tax=unclassified Methanoculleus TaxID=2619537 RepID=UPI0025E71776|nr:MULTISPECIES: type II toxin-antitoxin system Phd/YefM family antitoxin [unclassified Methanoculleus]